MLHLLLFPKDCVGCGYCCSSWQCPPGQEHYGPHRRCPGLYWNGERYRCRLIEERPDIASILQTGEGCCRPLNRWRKNVQKRL